MTDPIRVDVAPAKVAVDRIEQRVFFVGAKEKRALLEEPAHRSRAWTACWCSPAPSAAPTASAAISPRPALAAVALHGNKAQNARVRALDAFRNGHVRILVATDIAARGIDVPNISHVINYELPNEPESYVHRIGRTARAGAEGAALSFCDQSERPYLQAIERLMRSTVTVGEHRLAVMPATPPHRISRAPQGKAPLPASGADDPRPALRRTSSAPRAVLPGASALSPHRGDLR